MVLANPRFQIDIAKQRPRPLVPAPHPFPLRQSAKEKNHSPSPLARDFFNALLGSELNQGIEWIIGL
jgi:hypothetical protein